VSKTKLVYVGMVADGLHHGHINIIDTAASMGDVIIGLLVDEAVKSYKRTPILNFSQRRQLVSSLRNVHTVVPQYTLDYTKNILQYKPDILIHGDDWLKQDSPQHEIRKLAQLAMDSINGTILDIPYTTNISTTKYLNQIADSLRNHRTYWCIESLTEIITHANNILLLTYQSFNKCSAYDKINQMLANKKVKHFYNFGPNVHDRDLKSILDKIIKFEPEIIVCIGGGTVIDMGKLINAFLANSQPLVRVCHKQCRLVAIPTTAGSGSESTHFAVLYKDNLKYSISEDVLRPDDIILDSSLLMTLNYKTRLHSLFDALCQSIESYWSVNSTYESKKYSKMAMLLIKRSIKQYLNNPDLLITQDILLASHFAGKAINITKTSLPHAISYPITIKYGITHGRATAFSIGQVMLYNYNITEETLNDNRGIKYVQDTILEIINILGYQSIEEFINDLRTLKDNINIDINYEEVARIALASDRSKNNPRSIDKENLINLLTKCE
jgi:cytidyltransferase-like protein